MFPGPFVELLIYSWCVAVAGRYMPCLPDIEERGRKRGEHRGVYV